MSIMANIERVRASLRTVGDTKMVQLQRADTEALLTAIDNYERTMRVIAETPAPHPTEGELREAIKRARDAATFGAISGGKSQFARGSRNMAHQFLALIADIEAALAKSATAPPSSPELRLEWRAGPPPKPWSEEWFIAETTYGDRACLTALPEEWAYDFKTADETYIKAEKIKRWMQFPDSDYTAPDAFIPSTPAPDLREAGESLAWLAEHPALELSHYQPVYGDDDDDAVEWRVHRRSGCINDREWTLIGAGETPLAAIKAAMATLPRGSAEAEEV